MSKILEKATAHFRAQLNNSMEVIDVPEWETKIYFKKVTTLKEESKVLELSQQGKTVEALVESIIMRARNEDGTKMFSMPDKITLMNEVDPRIIIRVAGEMNGVKDTLDEVEKN